MKHRYEHSGGFTLLELLVAILLFSILASTLFVSYRTLFMGTRDFENGRIHYEMAQTCLSRIAKDLRALHINLPPQYTKPGMASPPGDYRVVGEQASTGSADFSRLRFTALAHLPPGGSPRRSGIAEIRYYVHTDRDGTTVLRRSDNLFPYPSFEEKMADPVLCEDIRSFTLRYYDESNEEHETWDSESADYKYAAPSGIEIELEVGNENTSRMFRTRIALPVVRKGIK